jgi:hypothetical protein
MKEQSWSSEEIRELIEYTQSLRKENEDLRAMVIASDAVIRNKEGEIKQLKLRLYAEIRNRNTTELG